ncbi:MAG: hypothetical protein NVS2B3_18840 [Vulcanimicrobiaceae bacterium]
MTRQRGFTVPELLISLLLFLALAVATLGALHGFVRALDDRSTAQNGLLTLEQTIARMRADAATAFAVFVPARDVFGAPNAGSAGTSGTHEVAYYTKTEAGIETWWAYHYDAVAHTLRRYDFDPATGRVGVFDRSVAGRIDTTARYPVLAGVRRFAATSLQANDLTDARRDAFAPVLSGLFAGRAPIGDPVGFVPTSGQLRPDLYGGNASVAVALDTDRGRRAIHLASGTMASGFTIHEAVAIRSFVYRKNTHHQSWIGFGYKSRAQIYAQLQYNLHPKDPTSKWRLWCDYRMYGAGKGIDYSKDQKNYNPNDFEQTAGYTFYVVTHDGVRDNDPSQCDPRIPTPNDTPPPTYAVPPAIADTPPPCFTAPVPCWPYNAPPNWSAPSPWPAASPPADWCAGHQASRMCGGDGGGPTAAPAYGDTPPPVLYAPPPPPATSAPTNAPERPARGLGDRAAFR